MTENKVKFGLENVHIFPIKAEEEGKLTYDAGFALPGAVSLTMDANVSTNDFYADNRIYYKSQTDNGYSGELTLAMLTDEFKEKILGQKKNKDGVIFESADDKIKEFAMTWEFKGDSQRTRVLAYRVIVSKPTQSYNTTTENSEPQTDALNYSFLPRVKDSVILNYVHQDGQAYADWHSKPYEGTVEAEAEAPQQ